MVALTVSPQALEASSVRKKSSEFLTFTSVNARMKKDEIGYCNQKFVIFNAPKIASPRIFDAPSNVQSVQPKTKSSKKDIYIELAESTLSLQIPLIHGKPIGNSSDRNGGGPCCSPDNGTSRALDAVPHGGAA